MVSPIIENDVVDTINIEDLKQKLQSVQYIKEVKDMCCRCG